MLQRKLVLFKHVNWKCQLDSMEALLDDFPKFVNLDMEFHLVSYVN